MLVAANRSVFVASRMLLLDEGIVATLFRPSMD